VAKLPISALYEMQLNRYSTSFVIGLFGTCMIFVTYKSALQYLVAAANKILTSICLGLCQIRSCSHVFSHLATICSLLSNLI